MRPRREATALGILAIVLVLGLVFMSFDFGTAENERPVRLNEDYEENPPEDIQEEPASARGNIANP